MLQLLHFVAFYNFNCSVKTVKLRHKMYKRDESHEEINDLVLVRLVRNILVMFANLATVMVTVNTTDDEDDDDEVICVTMWALPEWYHLSGPGPYHVTYGVTKHLLCIHTTLILYNRNDNTDFFPDHLRLWFWQEKWKPIFNLIKYLFY